MKEVKQMKLTEKEAWIIVRAIDTAQMGRESKDELKLLTHIRQEFPAVDKKLKQSELKDNLWKDNLWLEAEKDSRVKKARAEMNAQANKTKLGSHPDNPEEQKLEKLRDAFFEVKEKVFRKLKEKYMVSPKKEVK